MGMIETSTDADVRRAILDALEPHRNRREGSDRYNTPWRPGADGGTLTVTERSDYALGLSWYDHKDGESGNGITLAQNLNIPLGRRNGIKLVPKPKPAYTSLDDYAQAHGIPADVLIRAGWRETQRRGGLAFAYPTDTGTRYRYADETRTGRKYDSDGGGSGSPCWYGLTDAVALAESSSGALVLCNGETSTLVAQAHGIPAACVTGGEKSSIKPELLDQLRQQWSGAIVIAFDCDQTGRTAGNGLATHLCAEGWNARAVDLGGSDGFDLADWCKLHPDRAAADVANLPELTQRKPPAPPTPPATPAIETLGALMAKTFAPVRWVIPELLPEGAVILAGAPKQGKSLLALNIALAVSAGSVALGSKITNPGHVLYLALEDGERRLQDRVRGITARGVSANDNFHYATDWPRTDEHGATYLDGWLADHTGAQLVVIDTLKKVRPSRKAGEDLYDFDYHALDVFHQVATQRRVCVLIIHHTRKAESDDYLETLSGSNAIAGAVDGVMVLKKPRNNPDGILHITGRDIDETELALRMDYPVWTLLGDAAAERMTQEYKAVLGALHGGVALGIRDILDAVAPLDPKANYNTVRQRLYQMKEKGILLGEGGKYRTNPANPITLVKHPNNPNNPNNPNSPNSPNNVVRVPGEGDTPPAARYIAGLDAAIQAKMQPNPSKPDYLAELMGGDE